MKHIRILAALLSLLLLTGCGAAPAPAQTQPPPETEALPTEAAGPDTEEKETEPMNHAVIVYFAGWHLGTDPSVTSGEVAALPWDSVTCINHAFWAVEPADGTNQTSFERRRSGEGARTAFHIVPLDAQNDLGDCGESSLLPGIGRNHFAQYAAMHEQYPDVTIFLSIGGWTRCGYFSEMAYTAEGRQSFVDSCVQVIRENPWIGGIDIDWEYPAGSRDGERTPGDDEDQGCPIFGTATQDKENFVSLLKLLRQTLDAEFGVGQKKVSACSSGSTTWTLPCQDWKGAAEWLDYVNIMSYDLAGPWDGVTGLASSASLAKAAAMYMKLQRIPLEKICIGSPLYGSPFRMTEVTLRPLGAAVEPVKPTFDSLGQELLRQWEAQASSGYRLTCTDGRYALGDRFGGDAPGWHMDYEAKYGSPYLWNDDPQSEYYKWFLSYENNLSLQEKTDYILDKELGGIIVWEADQDADGFELIRQMYRALNPS